jgi:hypothetical protein
VRKKGGRSEGDGGIIEWTSSEVNTKAVSRGLNKFTDEFKMTVGDAISNNNSWVPITMACPLRLRRGE